MVPLPVQVAERRRTVGILDEFICGSLAGTIAWVVNYPSDKAKTIVQWRAGREPAASDMALLRPHLRAQGIAFLWLGMGATLLRSIPQTGATVVAYAESRRLLTRLEERLQQHSV